MKSEVAWWQKAVGYEIYPRSFMDSNGDGIGDLPGILSKLAYLEKLGVTLLWICPVYPSPNDDNGYDISDYEGVDRIFGTMEDLERLLQEAHRRGMKVILDLVINHTSDEHPWFMASRGSKDSPYRDYYIWRDGKNGAEPNNWESIFGGSAWEWDEGSGQYYLHLFSRKQPDLNWENPAVRQELYRMIRWWLDKGIDGFRVDAISHIKKVPGLPDLPNPKQLRYVPSYEGHMNREGIHRFLEELKREAFAHYNIVTVGESNGVSAKEAGLWVGEPEGKFNMIFQFEHVGLWDKGEGGGMDVPALKRTLTRWQKALEDNGWNALFLENHDLARSVSTWGDDGEYWQASATALATMYFLMRGTPFIYQGQELGMTNVQFPSIEDYNDVSARNLYRLERERGKTHEEVMAIIWKIGRDNARTPMQWNDRPQAGFTTGEPWLKVNPNYTAINAARQMADPDSIWSYYRRLIELRASRPVFVDGAYQLLLPRHKQIYAYLRENEEEKILVIVNLTRDPARFRWPRGFRPNIGELLLWNEEAPAKEPPPQQLRPYEARVYKLL